jgi:hypothetical protein
MPGASVRNRIGNWNNEFCYFYPCYFLLKIKEQKRNKEQSAHRI